MHSRRRNNTASGSGAVNTRNRRQINSMPEDAAEDYAKDLAASVTASNRKRTDSVEGDKNPIPILTHNEIRSRSSNEENNDPNLGDSGGVQVQAPTGHRPGKEMNVRGHSRLILQEDGIGNRDRGDNLLEEYSQLNVNRDGEFTIYFVMADSLTEATCSSRLSMAFHLCSEQNLAAEWITAENCLKKVPQPGNIFVVDPFEGLVYDHLAGYFYNRKGTFRIIGPQCLRQSFERQRQNERAWKIPNRAHPMFTLGMSEVIVTTSALRDKARKEQLLKLIHKMAGFYTPSFTMAVTHVLADCVLSAKCAVAHKSGVPVMRAEWVEEVWKESLNDISKATDSHFARYVCPIFYNVNFCFSQLDSGKKESLRKIIESNGGIYSAQLHKERTQVLVIEKGTGEKFRYAKQWGVVCVKPDWITDSKHAGHILPTEKYQVRFAGSNKDLVSTQLDSRMDVPLDEISVSAIVLDDVSHCNQSGSSTKFRSQVSEAIHPSDPEPIYNDIEAIIKGGCGNHSQFLDGCRVYLSGTAAETYEPVRKLLNLCGATRLDRLNGNASHVVVLGVNLLDSEAQVLKTLSPKPFLVTIDWIIASYRKGELADEEEFAFNENNTAQARGASGGQVKNTSAAKRDSRATRGDESVEHAPQTNSVVVGEGFEKEDDLQILQEFDEMEDAVAVGEGFDHNQDGDDNFADIDENQLQPDLTRVRSSASKSRSEGSTKQERAERQEAVIQEPESPVEDDQDPQDVNNAVSSTQGPSQSMTKIFGDYRFDVLLQSNEENSEIKQSIKGMGGVISKDADIVILPPVYMMERAKTESQHFTKFWVLDCQEVKSPNIQMLFYHVPMKAFTGMRKIMPDVVIAASGYQIYEKKYIEGVATAMGARFQDVFARKTQAKNNVFQSTHLICSITDNDKYRAAIKWNVPVVRHEWIIECFNAECKLDIGPFRIDKAETKGSILMETPKSRNKGVSVIPVTSQQPEKFKLPVPLSRTPRHSVTPTAGEDTLRPHRRSSSDVGVAVNAHESAEDSPYFKGLSRLGSRQLKATLDRLTSDSPSPDLSSVRIKTRRNSTPEAEAFAGLWNTFRQKFPGKATQAPKAAAESTSTPPRTDSGVQLLSAKTPTAEVNTNRKESDTPRSGLKRPSDPEISIEETKPPETDKADRAFKKPKTTDTLNALMTSEFGTLNEEQMASRSSSNKLALSTKRNRRMVDSQLPLPPDVAPEVEAVESGKVYWDDNKERPVDTHKRVEAELSQVSGGSGDGRVEMASVKDSSSAINTKSSSLEKSSKSASKSKSPSYTFMLTGFAESTESGRLTQIIQALGGTVNTSSKYEEGVDALIAKKYARSEKVLSTIAAGKPLVVHTYVLESEKAGKLLDFTEYVVKPHPDVTLTPIETHLIQAANYWYAKIKTDPNSKPFSGICAVVIEPSETKCSAYKNLIRTGGGKIWEKGCDEVPNLLIGDEAHCKKKLKSLPKICSTLKAHAAFYLNDVILKSHLKTRTED